MEIKPITFRDANEYVREHHRHNAVVSGCKFCLSCYDGERLCGVAICGRPVSRYLDDGVTLEINRVCTDGTRNACSMLYGASISMTAVCRQGTIRIGSVGTGKRSKGGP